MTTLKKPEREHFSTQVKNTSMRRFEEREDAFVLYSYGKENELRDTLVFHVYPDTTDQEIIKVANMTEEIKSPNLHLGEICKIIRIDRQSSGYWEKQREAKPALEVVSLATEVKPALVPTTDGPEEDVVETADKIFVHFKQRDDELSDLYARGWLAGTIERLLKGRKETVSPVL